jgi:hypothetical protein
VKHFCNRMRRRRLTLALIPEEPSGDCRLASRGGVWRWKLERLNKAIEEGSMNWVVAAFQDGDFAKSARSKGEMLLNCLAMLAGEREVDDEGVFNSVARDALNAKGKKGPGKKSGRTDRTVAQ